MPDVYGELIGCANANYAKVLSDTTDGYSAGPVKYLAPSAEFSHEAKTDNATRYYDNKIRFVTITEGATEVKVTVSGVPCNVAAELTGKPYDAARGIFIDTGDASNTPWYAFSGEMDLGDGGSRFFQYLKGKFAIGAQDAVTREDKTTAKTVDLTYTAVVTNYAFDNVPEVDSLGNPTGKTTHKNIKGVFADTTMPAFTGAATWYSQVQTPETMGKPAVMALSNVVPADDATGVLASAKPVLTFSNAVGSESILLVKSSDNSIVEVTKSYDSTGKILTLTPGANLTAGGYQLIVTGVKDVFGQSLPSQIINFTVGS